MSFPLDPVCCVAKPNENPAGVRTGGVHSSVPSTVEKIQVQGHLSQTHGSSNSQALWSSTSGLYVLVTGYREDDPGWTGLLERGRDFWQNKTGLKEGLELQQEVEG